MIVPRPNMRLGGTTRPIYRDVTASGTGAVEEITTTSKPRRNVSRHVQQEVEDQVHGFSGAKGTKRPWLFTMACKSKN